MSKRIYSTIMSTEVKADCYGGDDCDEVSTYFETYCDGDKQSDSHKDDIIISLNTLPAGAKILVEYPCCPECDLPREDVFNHLPGGRMEIIGHEDKCDCGFDWNEWVLHQYS